MVVAVSKPRSGSYGVQLNCSGAANITADDTAYADGGIVREGPTGDQGDGPYSAGRGGVANIHGTSTPRSKTPHDEEIVPETATRITKEESHHVGRGGAGNESHVHKTEDLDKKSIGDKVKELFHKK